MIIGLCGEASAGKDTCADFLVRNHGFVKVALADPLKRIVRQVYDFSDEQLWGPSEKRNEPDKRYLREYVRVGHMLTEEALKEFPDGKVPQYLTPRFALQTLGTEWGRTCYNNTWVDLAIRTAKTLLHEKSRFDCRWGYDQKTGLHKSTILNPHEGVVFSDVRFRNEIDAIHAAGGKVVRLVRVVRKKGQGKDAAWRGHQSEAEMRSLSDDLFDFSLVNNTAIGDEDPATLQLLEVAVSGLYDALRRTA